MFVVLLFWYQHQREKGAGQSKMCALFESPAVSSNTKGFPCQDCEWLGYLYCSHGYLWDLSSTWNESQLLSQVLALLLSQASQIWECLKLQFPEQFNPIIKLLPPFFLWLQLPVSSLDPEQILVGLTGNDPVFGGKGKQAGRHHKQNHGSVQ